MVVAVTGKVPDPASLKNAADRQAVERALEYMGLQPGMAIQDNPSRPRLYRIVHQLTYRRSARCGRYRARTQSRQGRARDVVPGSQQVKAEAEKLGLDRVFLDAGFEWREIRIAACAGMNPDILKPGERMREHLERNFEGRQGKGGRTHLVSPVMGGGRGRERALRRRARMAGALAASRN